MTMRGRNGINIARSKRDSSSLIVAHRQYDD
jgi:hypothetical protein